MISSYEPTGLSSRLNDARCGSSLKEVDKNTKISISKEQGTKQVDGLDKKNDDEIKCSEDAITEEAVFKMG